MKAFDAPARSPEQKKEENFFVLLMSQSVPYRVDPVVRLFL